MNAARWRLVLWLLMLAAVLFVAWSARTALIPFAIGALLAYTLTPVVDVVAWVIPAAALRLLGVGRHRAEVYRRGIAVLLVYAAIGVGMFGAGSVVVPIAVDQTVDFVDRLPVLVEDAREQTSDWLTQYRERVPENVQERIDGYVEDAGSSLSDRVASTLKRSVNFLTGAIGVAFGFLIVPFWMFYALRDRHAVGRNFMNAVPEQAQADIASLLAIADQLLLRYVRAQIFLGVVVGTAVGVGLTLMNVQLSLGLGVIAGITELIPIIGPWIGAVPGLLIVASTDPGMLVWVALLYLLVQQVENVLLVPRVQGRAVDLHPAIIMLLLVVAGAVFGFIGLVVIVPLTAILREVFWYADHRLTGSTPAEAFALTNVAKAREARRPLAARLVGRLRARLRRRSGGRRNVVDAAVERSGGGDS